MAEVQQATKSQLEANEKARAARKEQQKEAEAQVKENQAQKEKTNNETMERQNNSKPTPTQAENDLAAAGQSVDEHEYDGSPPQGVTPEDAVAAAKYYKQPEDRAHVGGQQHTRKLEAKPSGQYQTRAATTKPTT
jgi:hypothetical protein